jgi:RodZ C-terminal domain
MTQESTFDEQRVLAELEQLQLAIRATRAQRERVQAEFDAQLRAFEPPTLSHTPPPAKPGAFAVSSIPADGAAPVAARSPETVIGRAAESEPVGEDAPASSRSSVRLLAIVAGIVLVASFALVWMFNRAPSASPPPVTQQPARTIPSVPALPEVRKPAAPPVDPHLLRIDLKTLRRVWLRVSVDGRIAIEREVAEGEQLPFGADRSIVVRAGDAGAVTVRVGDVDQGTIGRDGEVLTRTFTAPTR